MTEERYTKFFLCSGCGLRWDVHRDSAEPPRPKCCPSCKRKTGFKQVGSSYFSVASVELLHGEDDDE